MEFFKIFTIEESIEEWVDISRTQKDNLNNLFNDFFKISISRKYFVDSTNENNQLKRLNELDKTEKNLSEICHEFAENLLNEELIQENDGSTRRNYNIKSGVLIIKITTTSILLLKLEEVESIDKQDFSKKNTYGGEKNYYKLALMNFSDEKLLVDVYDANPRIAKYWSEGFLMLNPLRDEEKNTDDLINLVKSKTLFKENENLNNEDAINSFEKYISENNKFSFDNLTVYINEIFKKDFSIDELFEEGTLDLLDEQFDLHSETVSKFLKRKIIINDQVTLDVKNISRAVNGGRLELSKDNRFIMIKIKNEIDIHKSIPNLKKGD